MRNDIIGEEYYDDLSEVTILSKEEERYYLLKYKKCGCIRSRNKIIKSVLRYVVTLAKKYAEEPEKVHPLICAGNEAVLKAVDHFDLDKGSDCKFSSYAYWHITEAMRQQLNQEAPVSGHKYRKKDKQRVKKHVQRHRSNPEDDVNYAAIAEEVNMSVDQVRKLAKAPNFHGIGLDQLDRDLSENRSGNVWEKLEDDDYKNKLRPVMKELPPRHRFCVRSYYGIGTPELNYREIGEELDLTHERVRQITIESKEMIEEALRNRHKRIKESLFDGTDRESRRHPLETRA